MAKLRSGRHDIGQAGNKIHRMDSYEEYRKTKMCLEKASYATDLDAIHAAITMSTKYGPLRVYHCEYCNHYHLTTQTTA